MKKETYIKMTQPFRDNPELAKGLHIMNKLCTGVMYLTYPLLLVYLFLHASLIEWMKALCVPAISFVLLTVVRAKWNRPRPYEVYEVAPVIKKDTKGNSFPSRHVFSATIIAMTVLLMSPWNWLGICFLAVAFALAVVRVISGVHFISDVVAGFFVAVIVALLGYCFL